MAQDSKQLDLELKKVKDKTSAAKPWGFTLIIENNEGIPEIYIAKTEMMAKNISKPALKTAKKKKPLTGLIFWDNGLVFQSGKKALKESILLKTCKRMARNSAKFKTKLMKVCIKNTDTEEDLQISETATKADKSKSKADKSKDKVLDKNFQKVLGYSKIIREMIEDLDATLNDLHVDFERAKELCNYSEQNQTSKDTIKSITKELSDERKEISALMIKFINDVEKPITEDDVDYKEAKDKIMELRKEIKLKEQELDNIEKDILKLAQGGVDVDTDLFMLDDFGMLQQKVKILQKSIGSLGLGKGDKLPKEIDALCDVLNGEIKVLESSEQVYDPQKLVKYEEIYCNIYKEYMNILLDNKKPKEDPDKQMRDIWNVAFGNANILLNKFKKIVCRNPKVQSQTNASTIIDHVQRLIVTKPEFKKDFDFTEVLEGVKKFEFLASCVYGEFPIYETVKSALTKMQEIQNANQAS